MGLFGDCNQRGFFTPGAAGRRKLSKLNCRWFGKVQTSSVRLGSKGVGRFE